MVAFMFFSKMGASLSSEPQSSDDLNSASISVDQNKRWENCGLQEDAPLTWKAVSGRIAEENAVEFVFNSDLGVCGMKYLQLPHVKGTDGYSFWLKGDKSLASVQIRLSQRDWSAWDSPIFAVDWKGWKKIVVTRNECNFHDWGKAGADWDKISIFAFRVSGSSCSVAISGIEFHVETKSKKLESVLAPPMTISVDLSKTLPPIPDNLKGIDFALVNWGASQTSENFYRQIQELLKKSGAKIVRFWPFCPALGLSPRKGVYDFAKFDRQMDMIKSVGAKSLMTCCFTPEWLSIDGSKEGIPKNWDDYESLISALVTHCKEKGYVVEYWEVWNEPDLSGGAFLKGGFEELASIYRHFASAIRSVEPDARVGGGGFSSPSPAWTRKLVEFCVKENLPSDFLSWHVYDLSPDGLSASISAARKILSDYPSMKNTRLVIDEWNSAGGPQNQYDSEFAAAFQVAALDRMLRAGLDCSVFFAFNDSAYHYKIRPPVHGEFGGSWGLITEKNNPKASYNSFKMFSELDGERCEISGADSETGAIAVKKDGQISILLYRFRTEADAADREVKIELKGAVPETFSKFEIELVDKSHSNRLRNPESGEIEKILTLFKVEATKIPSLMLAPLAVARIRISQ